MPNNPDEQEIPKKLSLLIKAKNNYLEEQKLKKNQSNGVKDENEDGHKEASSESHLLDSTKHMG